MKSLIELGDHLKDGERDEWVRRVSVLDSRLSEDDELRIILDAMAIVASRSTSLEEQLKAVVESKTNPLTSEEFSNSMETMAVNMSDAIDIPSFNELRDYVADSKKIGDLYEKVESKSTQSIELAQNLISEIKKQKSGGGAAPIIVGLVVGVLVGVISSAVTPHLLKLL